MRGERTDIRLARAKRAPKARNRITLNKTTRRFLLAWLTLTMRPTGVLLAWLGLALLVLTQDDRQYNPQNHFTNPIAAGPVHGTLPSVYDSNPVYLLGDSQTWSWVTTIPAVNLSMWQEGGRSIKLIST